MITRVRLASAAFVLLFASASVSFAQSDSTTSIPVTPSLRAGMKSHTGGVGAQFGESYMFAGGDYSKGARPRFAFTGSFRYVAASHFGWQLNPYFTWAAYRVGTRTPIVDPAYPTEPFKDHYLAQIAGANAQLLWLESQGSWTWHVGAGPALYRVVLQNHRRVIKDPVTFDRHQGTYLGATAEIGAEHFLKNLTTTSLEWTVAWHSAFARRNDQFPSGFNDAPQVFEVRFGGHYYYDLGVGKKPGAKPAPGR